MTSKKQNANENANANANANADADAAEINNRMQTYLSAPTLAVDEPIEPIFFDPVQHIIALEEHLMSKASSSASASASASANTESNALCFCLRAPNCRCKDESKCICDDDNLVSISSVKIGHHSGTRNSLDLYYAEQKINISRQTVRVLLLTFDTKQDADGKDNLRETETILIDIVGPPAPVAKPKSVKAGKTDKVGKASKTVKASKPHKTIEPSKSSKIVDLHTDDEPSFGHVCIYAGGQSVKYDLLDKIHVSKTSISISFDHMSFQLL